MEALVLGAGSNCKSWVLTINRKPISSLKPFYEGDGVRFFKNVRPLFSIYLTTLGVEDGKEQLRSINISDLVSDIFAEDTIEDKAPQFDSTFRAMLSLVQNCRTNTDGTKPSPISGSTSNTTEKRSAEVGTVEESAKRTKVLHKPSSPRVHILPISLPSCQTRIILAVQIPAENPLNQQTKN